MSFTAYIASCYKHVIRNEGEFFILSKLTICFQVSPGIGSQFFFNHPFPDWLRQMLPFLQYETYSNLLIVRPFAPSPLQRLLRCRVRDKPYGYSLPKERNVRLSPHSAHVSITHNIPFARLDWNS